MLLLAVLIIGPAELGWSQFTGPIGTIVVGFTGSLPQGFQNISFNVVSVRLNPSTDPFVSDFDPNWVTVPVARGVGLNSGGVSNPFLNLSTLFNLNSSGQTPGGAGTGPSELTIDMGQIATLPQMFNSWIVPASTYRQIEMQLSGLVVGSVIPDCTGRVEGCITSQMATITGASSFRASSVVTVPLGGVTTLIVGIDPVGGGSAPPAFSGANYSLQPTIFVPSSNSSVGLITGQGFGATQVLAELAGTNQVVETTTLGGGFYTLVLPAASDGTYYDLVASSNQGYAYVVAHNVLVQRGSRKTVNLNSTFTGSSSLSGNVSDLCSGQPIQGATVELVEPAPGTRNDCANVPTPANCVALATANTDDLGKYPMPPSNLVLQAFTSVADGNYTMVVSAAGYSTAALPATISGVNSAANFSLSRSQINGLVTLVPPLAGNAPAALNVLVTAEDHGTHHIENVALATVPPGSSSAPFSMFVPDASRVRSLDMYAAVSDLFSGLPEKYTGHTIAVVPGVASASTCGIVNAPQFVMQCVGNASLFGNTTTFDSGTSIVLSKNGVQLMNSGVIAATPNPSSTATPAPGLFSFCAPADPGPYTLQRYEIPTPGAQPSPAASPTSVTMLSPSPIGPPCNSICSNGSGACLVCQNKSTVQVP